MREFNQGILVRAPLEFAVKSVSPELSRLSVRAAGGEFFPMVRRGREEEVARTVTGLAFEMAMAPDDTPPKAWCMWREKLDRLMTEGAFVLTDTLTLDCLHQVAGINPRLDG